MSQNFRSYLHNVIQWAVRPGQQMFLINYTDQHCRIWLQMFVEMVCMHPGNCRIYLKAQDTKMAENGATVRTACYPTHHLNQSARK